MMTTYSVREARLFRLLSKDSSPQQEHLFCSGFFQSPQNSPAFQLHCNALLA